MDTFTYSILTTISLLLIQGDDHDYCNILNVVFLSEFKEACINYIAGFVVKSLTSVLTCQRCVEALSDKNKQAHVFIMVKDRGGLKRPSQSRVTLCMGAEKCFQRMLVKTDGKLPQCKGISQSIASAVLENTSNRVLFSDLLEHQFNTTIDDNHLHKLVKLVVMKYIKIRMFHLTKQYMASISPPSIRSHLTKSILFLHQ